MARKIVEISLYILALLIAGFAVFLLIRGAQWSSVPVVEPGVPLPEPQILYERPYWPAIFPILGSLLVPGGLMTGKMIIAWIGIGALITYSLLFVFSYGGLFLLPALLLAALLSIYQLTGRSQRS